MSSANGFLKEMVALRPELYAFYDAEQYQLSEQIIEYMVTNCLTEEQMSKLLGIEFNYCLRLSSGDNTIDVSEYKQVLKQLQNTR